MEQKKFILLVTASPFQNEQARTACHFAYALLKQQQTIQCVFFYDEGVFNSNPLLAETESNRELVKNWHTLATSHQVPLRICATDSINYGLFSAANDTPKLTEGFITAGLGQLFNATNHCDRFIVF